MIIQTNIFSGPVLENYRTTAMSPHPTQYQRFPNLKKNVLDLLRDAEFSREHVIWIFKLVQIIILTKCFAEQIFWF